MSYVNQLLHAVIRTYRSDPVLPMNDNINQLYKYVSGITNVMRGKLYQINSMQEHVHMLFTLPATISLSDFMKEIKGSTSRLMKEWEGFERFHAWGEGYAAISKSIEDKGKIISYISNQQEHHKKHSFRTEYEKFVREMGYSINEADWDR